MQNLETPSFTSKVLHRLGCRKGESPAALGMPSDFYLENGDRKKDRKADVRSKAFIRRTLVTGIFGYYLGQARGPKWFVYMAVFCLAVSTVGLWGAKEVHDHYVTAANNAHVKAQTEAAAEQAKALAALGPVDLAHCSKHMDDFNGLDADPQKWGDDDKTMGAFRNQCVSAELIGSDKGNPPQYHARKYDKTSLATINAQACAAHLADINTMAGQPGWQNNMDPDVMALRMFALNCTNSGLIHARDGQALADHAVFSVRKYTDASLMFATSATCNAALNDMNAVVGKPGWRDAGSNDAKALASYSSMCVLNGFLKATPGANDTETLSSTGKP
jgi:hypothetical protein